MIDCISVENMRLSDAYTIENLVPSLELMHRAAWGVYLAAQWCAPVAIVCGSGNNGGDGFALACILRKQGIDCTVFTLGTRLSPDSAHYARSAEALSIPARPFEEGCLRGFATVVDCLLGTGFQGGIRDNYRAAIEEINASGAYTVSVDINSGMNGDTGEAETAVKSQLTVTIGYVKNGLVQANAGKYMEKLVCADIGIQLLREENKLLAPGEEAGAGKDYLSCPDWLDITPINAIV